VNRVVIKDLSSDEIRDVMIKIKDTMDLMGISRVVPQGFDIEGMRAETRALGLQVLNLDETGYIERIEYCSTSRLTEFTFHTFRYFRRDHDYLEAIIIEMEDDINALQLQLAIS
jgi:hypothetical protein